MATFKNLVAGDKVRFRSYGGLKLERGKTVPEWKVTTGTVVRYLCFEDHVIAYVGGRPYVVDHGNFISKVEPKAVAA
jgi:hypothetical protein